MPTSQRPSSPRSSAKRPRVTPSEPERHPQLWFDDGNIVLRAQDVVFRVHRSMLSRHSEVFEGLFALCQPSEDELYDGIPMVELHDTSNELADLLNGIYTGLK